MQVYSYFIPEKPQGIESKKITVNQRFDAGSHPEIIYPACPGPACSVESQLQNT
jgi:hypothetical protein